MKLNREAWDPCKYCSMNYMEGIDLTPTINGHLGIEVLMGKCDQNDAMSMILYYKNASAGYIDFDFCPFCGRPQNEKAWENIEQKLKR